MLVLINALKSISRSKWRNILIGIIVLTISVSSCVALAIRSAAANAEKAGLEQLNITAEIVIDSQKLRAGLESGQGGNMQEMRERMSQYTPLSLDELKKYANSSYAKEFYYTSTLSLDATGEIEPYSLGNDSNNNNNNIPTIPGNGQFEGGARPNGGGGFVTIGAMAMGDFSITGYSSESAMTKFMTGVSSIESGEMFDVAAADINCLISSELAMFNDLSVNDTITLSSPNNEEETYEFTIVGIYTDSSSGETGGMRFSTSQDPANLICVSHASLEAITSTSADAATVTTDDNGNESSTALTAQVSGTYVFSNTENMDSFSAEATANGLGEYYTIISPDVSNYEASLIPLKNLNSFATTMLTIILIIGAIILVVLNMFNIRERKYEVGVLTAIGIKKWKVALQFVTELMCVTLLAIVIGAGAGAVISAPVSNNLLASQVAAYENEAESQAQSFNRPNDTRPQSGIVLGQVRAPGSNPAIDYLDKINAATDIIILLQLIGIGVALTVISSLSAVISVLRYEPLKILANRS